jgi:ABC-2 type transport system ATP-binding protein
VTEPEAEADTEADTDPEAGPIVPAEPPPALVADGLGLRTRHGWVFRPVSAVLPAGGVLGVHGPGGSGRSMLLLALSGRARASTGRLAVAGVGRPAEVRKRAAVARIGGAVELEPDLTVADVVRERRWLGGGSDARARMDRLGLRARPSDVVGELPAVESLLLALALAAAAAPVLLVVDDVDRGLDGPGRDRARAAIGALAEQGIAVVAAGTDPLPGADVQVALAAHEPQEG